MIKESFILSNIIKCLIVIKEGVKKSYLINIIKKLESPLEEKIENSFFYQFLTNEDNKKGSKTQLIELIFKLIEWVLKKTYALWHKWKKGSWIYQLLNHNFNYFSKHFLKAIRIVSLAFLTTILVNLIVFIRNPITIVMVIGLMVFVSIFTNEKAYNNSILKKVMVKVKNSIIWSDIDDSYI
ncbi:hypothetical protein EDC19_1653 [Natranaerovirga hydrolytica]|uniref:Uncharacterized protein n=1 Tax=Natranaerovirga hydrolytica TaxID=680378 RepID=A0A4R1MMV3_9FIRM|nr:hypothetical protein [Natranaerovirga hydrolytica]TCK93460.1 hypothetical protein EDC19_1653 [Natranaerovirga hydrolytica]